MRRSIPLFLLALLIIGCSEDSPVNVLTDSMSATVKGASWTAIIASSLTTGGITTVSGTRSITSTDDLIAIELKGVTGTGTFQLGSANTASAQYKKDSIIYVTTVLSLVPTGQVVLTQFGAGRVVGTFNFTAYRNGDPTSGDSVVVVNGSFNVKQN